MLTKRVRACATGRRRSRRRPSLFRLVTINQLGRGSVGTETRDDRERLRVCRRNIQRKKGRVEKQTTQYKCIMPFAYVCACGGRQERFVGELYYG
jgi:hypothetical protein